MPFRRHGCRIRNLPLFRWLYETPLVDMHAVDRRVVKPQRRDCSGAARKRADDRKRPPHRTGQFDLLGPFDPLCSAGNLHRRAGRPCNGIPQSLCPAQTPGRSCSLSDRSMARGLSTPLGRRKRAFLPRYHRGIVRDSPHRVQELRSYPFNAFRMESHGVAAHSGL